MPDAYHCKWSSCVLQNGVLRIRYPRDDDELDLEVDEGQEGVGDSRRPPHGAAAADKPPKRRGGSRSKRASSNGAAAGD